MTKKIKWAIAVVASPFILFGLLALLFYFPPFQNWAVRQVAAYASDKMGMEISVAHVKLEFPLDLGIEGVKAIQPNDSLPQVKDTIADVRKIVADVRLWPLLHKQVEIDELAVHDMKVNTANFIHEARVKGRVGMLELKAHGIDLGAETLKVDAANLKDAMVDVALSDTVPKDTAKTENFWKIHVDKLHVSHTDVTVHMPGDTLKVQAYLGETIAERGFFDLFKGLYQVEKFDWTGGRLCYDNNFKARVKGLDYNHIALTDVAIGIDSLRYLAPELSLNLRKCAFKEQSGLAVSALQGPLSLDSVRLKLPNLYFQTPHSELHAQVNLDLNAFDEPPGKFHIRMNGAFGKADLMPFMTDLPSNLRRQWPNRRLAVSGVLHGNLQQLRFTDLAISLPTVLQLRGNGTLSHLTDPKRLRGEMTLHARTGRLNMVTAMLDRSLQQTFHIPDNISVDGRVKFTSQRYEGRLVARQGQGSVKAEGSFDADRMAYQAKLQANRFPIQHFLPRMGLHPFTGSIDVRGAGTDFKSPRTHLVAKACIQKFRYAQYPLDHITAEATVSRGVANAVIHSGNPLLKGDIQLGALLNRRNLKGTVVCNLTHADLHKLHFADTTLATSLCAYLDVESDFKKFYKVQGHIGDIAIRDASRLYHPGDMTFDVLTRTDSTHAVVNCGDFQLKLDGHGGYERLLAESQGFVKELQSQLKNRTINQVMLRKRLPNARLFLRSGKDNFFVHALNYYGYQLARANINMLSSRMTGLNGDIQIDSLVVDSVLLDTVRFHIRSDHDEFVYQAQVVNNKKNPQYVFHAVADGRLNEHGSYLRTKLYDADNKLGVDLALLAAMEHRGIRFSVADSHPVLGYKSFAVNDSNYVFLGDDRRMSANLELKSADGMGLKVYTNDENLAALQDVTVSLHQFQLHDILSVVPYMPDVSGILDGDYHLIQTKDNLSVSSDMTMSNLVYEKCPMGNIGTEFVYMPKRDGSHVVDGILTQNGREIALVNGSYRPGGHGYLDAELKLERLPLDIVNGFIPRQIVGFKGTADGSLSVKGALNRPNVNGEVYLDSAYLVSVPYGVEMRFDNDPVTITDSKLLFENFQMYAHNNSPLIMSGSFDFSNLDRMRMNVRMQARNFMIIDAKESARSEAFGQAYVNFFGLMNGPVDNLSMRGKLDVLGSTDMTYILRDSPLTTDNQLDELVKFTDFKDEKTQVVVRPPLSGFNMDLALSISNSAHILCALNSDKSNYVDLMGGGDLRMQYNTVDNLRLTGRYTLSNGEMKYSLPVIPLKTFTIQDGSYIEFNGDPMNPRLSITATEKNKATVSANGGTGRSVEFDCGVKISKTLNDMGLEFIIDAPEDVEVQNQLSTMGKEARGKVAVTMLTTGMYLADGNTSAFSMNSALSAFLQSQINGIAGNALRTLDLSFGVDNTTDGNGNQRTDYSFKFAKRFWNNRLRVIIGGKLSTGQDVATQNESFFSNISFEYRLNEASTKYLRLFYDRDSYDWLEGDMGQYGAGFIWRRKLQHFRDLFKFKEAKNEMPAMPQKESATPTNKNGSDEKK